MSKSTMLSELQKLNANCNRLAELIFDCNNTLCSLINETNEEIRGLRQVLAPAAVEPKPQRIIHEKDIIALMEDTGNTWETCEKKLREEALL